MELLAGFVDVVLHLDQHLAWLVANYGAWIYVILFTIVFCETGLVVAPFLPGDSLLFVAGTLAAAGNMYVHGLFATLATASFLGDNTNYWIGRYLGPRVFTREGSRFLNPAHLARTQRFYDRYGAKTIFFARFVPIVRTFPRSWRASGACATGGSCSTASRAASRGSARSPMPATISATSRW